MYWYMYAIHIMTMFTSVALTFNLHILYVKPPKVTY